MSTSYALAVFCSVLNGLLIPLTLWFTFRTLIIIIRKHRENEARLSKRPSHINHVRSQKNNQGGRFTLNLTGLSSIFLSLGQISNLVFTSLVAERMRVGNKQNVFKVTQRRIFIFLGFAYVLCYCGGYIGLLLVCYERMRRVFMLTQYKLSEWKNVLFYLLAFGLICNGFAMVIAYYFLTRSVGTVLSITLVVGYTLCSIWVSHSFFNKTLMLSKGLSSTGNSNSNSNSNSTSQSHNVDSPSSSSNRSAQVLSQKAWTLMDASLRLAILANIAILSAMIGFSSVIVFPVLGSSHLFFIGITMHNIDYALNNLCLLCTLQESKPIYDRFFGCIHRYSRSMLSLEMMSEETSH